KDVPGVARARKDPSVPLTAAAAGAPLASSPRDRKDASVSLGAAARREPSGPLGARKEPSGAGEPVPRPRKMSNPQQEAVRVPVPDAAISSPGEGPMLGDNPLDAFAGSAAVALELDYAPWQERRPEDAEVKEKMPVQQATAGQTQREAPAAPVPSQARAAPVSRSADASLWWLLPAAVALLFVLFLLFPSLIFVAPPDDAAARAREAESAATRGSSRVLQRQRVEVSPAARPEQRELVE
ncbi:MAG TPA: hypothetical protein VMF89_32440, partial [Polyangiales bacterium]|nr:hypothetical protein [Polyangiales bacterium]